MTSYPLFLPIITSFTNTNSLKSWLSVSDHKWQLDSNFALLGADKLLAWGIVHWNYLLFQIFSLAQLVIQQAIGPLMDATKTRSCQMIKSLCVTVITLLTLLYLWELLMTKRYQQKISHLFMTFVVYKVYGNYIYSS